jgi:hypothetical protein
MKQEPEWIDVLALIAMHSFLQTAPKNAKPEQIAYAAYQQAEAMMQEKERQDEFE